MFEFFGSVVNMVSHVELEHQGAMWHHGYNT